MDAQTSPGSSRVLNVASRLAAGLRWCRSRLFTRSMALLCLSLVLGGAGVVLSRQYIEQEVAQARAQVTQPEAMVEVVVPLRPMQRGEVIRQDDLSVRDIPEQFADSHSVTGSTYQTALGQRLEFDIDEGRPLLWAHLEGGMTPTFSGHVPVGQRAMTLRVDDINSVSGFLQPRDRIDLLLTHGTGHAQKTVPLIQNLEVLATGVQTDIDKGGVQGISRTFSTITVQVNPVQAQRITLAQLYGQLTAMLRNPEDGDALDHHVVSIEDLLNDGTVATESEQSVPIESPEPVASRTVKPQTPSIDYIIGGS